jgi:hypothetical protein
MRLHNLIHLQSHFFVTINKFLLVIVRAQNVRNGPYHFHKVLETKKRLDQGERRPPDFFVLRSWCCDSNLGRTGIWFPGAYRSNRSHQESVGSIKKLRQMRFM